jgi:phospholipid transport system substrate-binding protein
MGGRMKIKGLFAISFLITFLTFNIFSNAGSVNNPTTELKSTIDSILAVLKDRELSLPSKKEERRKKISTLIRNRFDFREMARRSLARHWKKRTPEEQEEFVKIFSGLLEASYIGKIESYTDEVIKYNKEVIKGNGRYGVVSTSIVTKKVDIPIDYKLILKNNKWLVYDVVIEGVSFISTYRSQYNRIIRRESFAKLIQKMKNKLKETKSL